MITSLDGFMARPDGELDWVPVDPEFMTFANGFFRTVDGIVFGRVVYEGFVSFWDRLDPTDPGVTEAEVEFAGIFRDMTRIVVSRTLDSVDGDAILIKDDIAGEISRLKEESGRDLLLICGPELLATFVRLGLIDKYRIFVAPVLLGDGKPLFGGIQDELRLELVDTKLFVSGLVILDYQPERIQP